MPFLTDVPETEPKNDKLKRERFVNQIIHTIVSRIDTDSLTIGIYGAWGEGKTTVLNFIYTELNSDKYPDVLPVPFNPWRFSNEEQLLAEFFKVLVKEFGEKIENRKESLAQTCQEYLDLLKPVWSKIGGVATIGQVMSNLSKRASTVTLDEAKKRIANILINAEKQTVIIIDDIDRLDKAEIQTIFKLVKLTADFPYTTYVLAFDEQRVAEALNEKYGGAEGGRSFLEKIIQVPLRLPSPDVFALRELCLNGIFAALQESQVKLSVEEQQNFAKCFNNGLAIRLRIPRMGKRYANVLTFSLPILKGEVNSIDLMLLEGVRVFYPDMYSVIRDNRDIFLGTFLNLMYMNNTGDEQQIKQLGLEKLKQGYSGLTSDEVNALQEVLIFLFPRLGWAFVSRGIGFSHYGREWDKTWEEGQRICSPVYFNRYFTFSIQDYEVSDQEMISFISQIEKLAGNGATEALRTLVKTYSPDAVINHLQRKVNSIPQEATANLATAIIQIGDELPRQRAVWLLGGNTFSRAALLVGELIRRVEPDKRFQFTSQILLESTSLPFVREVYSWLHVSSAKDEQYRVFSEEQQIELRKIIADRIRHLSEDTQPLYVRFPLDAGSFFYLWAEMYSDSETNSYIEQTLKTHPQNAIELLKCYTNIGIEMNGGRQFVQLQQDGYSALAKVVNSSIVYAALHKIYGDDLNQATEINVFEISSDKDLALQFAKFYFLSESAESGSKA
jgi:predicted KAP-like P-loop ATPase